MNRSLAHELIRNQPPGGEQDILVSIWHLQLMLKEANNLEVFHIAFRFASMTWQCHNIKLMIAYYCDLFNNKYKLQFFNLFPD